MQQKQVGSRQVVRLHLGAIATDYGQDINAKLASSSTWLVACICSCEVYYFNPRFVCFVLLALIQPCSYHIDRIFLATMLCSA